MKSFIRFFLIVAFAFSQADAASLLYGLDFTKRGSNGLIFENIDIASGKIPFTTTGNAYANFVADALGDADSRACLYKLNGSLSPVFSVSNTGAGGLGVNTSQGFSISLNAKISNQNVWGNLLEFRIGNDVFQLQESNNHTISLYKGRGASTSLIGSAVDYTTGNVNTWMHLGLTFTGDTMTLFLNGEAVGSFSGMTQGDFTALGGAGGLTAGGGGYERRQGGIAVDNIGLYDGMLSGEDFKHLAKNGLVKFIPEPSTSALGLLGIMGLLVRRKRK